MLQRATASLAPAAVEYSIPRPTIEPPAKPDANGALARSVLREVRRSINGFRDDKWAGLLRARTRLVWTGTLTAGIAFALLVLAVLSQAPSKEVVAAMTFYLTGAIVGLFNQLRLAAGGRSVEEDCGFSRTRLLYVPILSGIAAVVGVVLIAMLHAVNGMVLTYGEARPAIDETIPTVHNIFQLTTNPFGLVLAAIFGLTPDLLVSRLQATADRYRDDLASTEAHGTGKT